MVRLLAVSVATVWLLLGFCYHYVLLTFVLSDGNSLRQILGAGVAPHVAVVVVDGTGDDFVDYFASVGILCYQRLVNIHAR